jgi:hypothetical protein
MKTLRMLATAAIVAAATTAHAAQGRSSLVLTASNGDANQLLVYNDAGTLLQTVSTQGQGGAGSNAGGIGVSGDLAAVVNFGSQSVAIFERNGDAFALRQVLPALSQPVSVAFGKDHLYVLGTTTVESHRVRGNRVTDAADGSAVLLRADGSAAQVGVTGNQIVITEKSGAVELVALRGGAVEGSPQAVALPAGVDDTPFGFTTRGSRAYITIAHSDAIALVRDGAFVASAATGTPNGAGEHSPCWIALSGAYLFSTNSPSHSISRLVATGHSVVLDEAVAARLAGAPIDVAAEGDLLAVVETNDGGLSHLNLFRIGADGELTLAAARAIAGSANGVAIVAGR